MTKRVLVVLPGEEGSTETDHYQVLQREAAVGEAERAGVRAEVVLAPGFDHLRVIRKRLGEASAPDAVLVEPANVAATDLILKSLKGVVGLVLLNARSPEIGAYARDWGAGLPFGSVSTDHEAIGRIQGRQVTALLPDGGAALLVTGPLRSSAGEERLAGLRSSLAGGITLSETEAGQWMESDGGVALERWYALQRTRSFSLHVIAAQSDELAVGARRACRAVESAEHREMLLGARLLGVDACPAFGRRLVDSGELTASVVTPPTTGQAIRSLQAFWISGRPLDLGALTIPEPYPPSSVGG